MAERRFLEYKPILDEVRFAEDVPSSLQIERIQREAGLDDEEIAHAQRSRPATGPGESRHRR